MNGSKWGADRPPFPLLQPEKVLSLPLQLRFDERLPLPARRHRARRRLRLLRRALRSRPERNARSIAARCGSIARTFARVKVSRRSRAALSAPVVSNEEIQTYAPVDERRQPADLPVHRPDRPADHADRRPQHPGREEASRSSDFRVNDADFEERAAEARAQRPASCFARPIAACATTSSRARRAWSAIGRRPRRKAMAMGVTLDPSYAFPLPIFGINYLELRVPRAAGHAARDALCRRAGRRQRAAAEDRRDAVRCERRLLRHRRAVERSPLRGGRRARAGAPADLAADDRRSTSAGSTRRSRSSRRSTSSASTATCATRRPSETSGVPASTVTNGFGGAWEYRRGGYSAVVNGAWFARAGWREWGFRTRRRRRRVRPTSSTAPACRAISTSGPFHKIHLNGAWFGGRDLDRFAKYQFGMFDDTRIHGVPASGVRFEEIGMARGSYSFNIFEQYRLDLFLEQAWGRDRAFDRGVAADYRHRRGGQRPRAVGHDSARRRRQELPAGALPRRRLGDAAGDDPEAAEMIGDLQAR